MSEKVKYYLNDQGEFVIENYHLAKPFSSFFPGVAGIWGVPIWAFYVNRGQAIASFGIKDKDHPIMEFFPANKSYQLASVVGFRTFIKLSSGNKTYFYDAFHNGSSARGFDIENRMEISSSALRLSELNRTLGLEVRVEYFTIPNDNYGALARKVSIRNISRKDADLQVIDGMPQVIPYGMNNFFLKELSRTIEAWMDVENLENNIPYLRLKVDPSDRPEVLHISEGNFYLAFDAGGLIKPIVDPEAIFGRVNDFTYPEEFLARTKFRYPEFQLTNSKTPCCMAYKKISLKSRGIFVMHSLAGNMDSLGKLKAHARRIANSEYFAKKEAENKRLALGLENTVFTHSSSRAFDFYCRQNFLDNVLRGGYPLSLDDSLPDIIIQVYSRKHGDLERDYNKFLLEPTYFSQGNGNYRDANQNRRSDIWFNPHLKEQGILAFFNLLQIDGYNPLVIKPDTFIFKGNPGILEGFFESKDIPKVKKRLEKPFTPGELLFFVEHAILKGVKSWKNREGFLKAIIRDSSRMLNAEHGEGFWSDHWTYCLDLLEAYLGMYPENVRHILLENREFTFFDNSETVRPRSEKYVLKAGKVFQYHALANNHIKNNLIRKRENFPHLSRIRSGQGEVYKTSLAVKMLAVIANKFAILDPFGVGIEMEANKPNWYDSLNGLPGLLGSSTCETFELKRWITFLNGSFKEIDADGQYSISLPAELYDLLSGLKAVSLGVADEYGFWDGSHALRERYLEKTLMGFGGEEKQLSLAETEAILEAFLKRIDSGLQKAYDNKSGLHYSYFINEVSEHEVPGPEPSGHSYTVRPLKFRQKPLPLFLEGAVHYLRIAEDREKARKVFTRLRRSPLYDKKLKMYKVTAPLADMPFEIGRCRVFTPGWLENESIWLHMEYKYLYELLKSGLYEEFFEDFKNVLIPFQDPRRYGRSILENSSFLASSAFPDSRLHGNGFVARLSGSTAEFISIWLTMCLGKEPFYLDAQGRLCLEFKPVLPAWLFSKKAENGFSRDSFAFRFLNKTMVVYHNSKRKDTFGPKGARIKQITLEFQDRPKQILKQPVIPSPLSGEIREGKVLRIDVFLV